MKQLVNDHAVPVISVIVPVFNGETYLAEALQSVFEQDYRPSQPLLTMDQLTKVQRWQQPILTHRCCARGTADWPQH